MAPVRVRCGAVVYTLVGGPTRCSCASPCPPSSPRPVPQKIYPDQTTNQGQLSKSTRGNCSMLTQRPRQRRLRAAGGRLAALVLHRACRSGGPARGEQVQPGKRYSGGAGQTAVWRWPARPSLRWSRRRCGSEVRRLPSHRHAPGGLCRRAAPTARAAPPAPARERGAPQSSGRRRLAPALPPPVRLSPEPCVCLLPGAQSSSRCRPRRRSC